MQLGPATIPGVREASLDLRALLFAAAISALAAILAGIVPAVRMVSGRMKEWLTERGSGQGVGGVRVQQALVVSQVGLAMALLVTAGLLVESFRQLRNVDPGFRPEQVVSGKVVLPASRYADASARIQFVGRLLDDLRQLPGVTGGWRERRGADGGQPARHLVRPGRTAASLVRRTPARSTSRT